MACSVKVINDEITTTIAAIEESPPHLDTLKQVYLEIKRIVESTNDSLTKLLKGDYGEFPENSEMEAAAKIAAHFKSFYDRIQLKQVRENQPKFLVEEIQAMQTEEKTDFLKFFLQKRFTEISDHLRELPGLLWSYISKLVFNVLEKHCATCPQILSPKEAVRHLVESKKDAVAVLPLKYLEMERLIFNTFNPKYELLVSQSSTMEKELMEELSKGAQTMMLKNISLELVNIDHLSNYNSDIVQKAFQVYIKVGIYWDIVSLRLVEFMMIYMTSTIQELVDKIEGDLFMHICKGLMGR
ncbi:PREDICTED: dynamin-related protein 4C-like [Nicotiana attenuata]|uniref:Dynamin-related protein 4c n=1 Tax=Nicotiana attenuata TaxID=49451 RepID=A0A1J6JXQ2_NICAT|nr:PREDICTED: dynamin-related protein 4C-like [Nicotiana attenuata]OIT21228.1 dynamin-related protein 4c [Nicotiana attenuata]